jgi:DNA-binding NarL/FixJ family response regulator
MSNRNSRQRPAPRLAGMKRAREATSNGKQGLHGKSGSARPLPPRLRRTLERLLLGESEKQVARALGISQHTVHEYVCGLYRHFSVNSRAELLARCFQGERAGRGRGKNGAASAQGPSGRG